MKAPKWYRLTPAGPVTLGNLTPVGQNAGQVGCRWPPNGHQLAACLKLPTTCQLWGLFWINGDTLYVPLPQTVYALAKEFDSATRLPKAIYRMAWAEGQWQVRPKHCGQSVEMIGGNYLISGNSLVKAFWPNKKSTDPKIVNLPWQTLTLSHNSREDYQVKSEGGFFAEMTTLIEPGWSVLVGIHGEYSPAKWGILGAGSMPVAISEVEENWPWLGEACEGATGGILLTGALWQKASQKISVPYPALSLKTYAAENGQPWQTWKKVVNRQNPAQKVAALTPGEWLTPAGAVYLWEGERPKASGPLLDTFHRHALGYGHLWLFQE